MSDDVPAWLDGPSPPTKYQIPRGNGRQPPVATPQDSTDFFEWLLSAQTRTELVKSLPDYIGVDQFIATAKDAALANQKLLAPNLRSSLLRAIFKAAKQGLRPDNKEGALVPRYDTETKQYGIVWQPMVWGLVKLGRLTGAIETIRPVIVFKGEHFEIEEGDVQVYRHKVDRQIVDEAYQALYGGVSRGENGRATLKVNPEDFFARVDCVYTIITPRDGAPVKRWMSRSRIALIRNQQGLNTPWFGPFLDEMICKTSILFTAKHIDLDISNPATERFREAMQHDMDIDFDQPTARMTAGAGGIGLLGHETKLDAFENLTAPDTREKVEVRTDVPEQTQAPRSQPGDVPMTSPRREVDKEAAKVREQIERLPTLGRVDEYNKKPWLVDWLASVRETDPKIHEEIMDALADRRSFISQKDKL